MRALLSGPRGGGRRGDMRPTYPPRRMSCRRFDLSVWWGLRWEPRFPVGHTTQAVVRNQLEPIGAIGGEAERANGIHPDQIRA